jgi:hypothetical protein
MASASPSGGDAASENERRGEIWSTRIQQELLSLTTDNADADTRSLLPPFTTVKDHYLDLTAGTCTVTVQIDIVSSKEVAQCDDSPNEPKSTVVTVDLDASMSKNLDGSLNINGISYPFTAPIPRLKEGKDAFPQGSTITEGDRIIMDLDWTPSLHLVDVIMNIGLKIRESILQGEPFHAAEPEDPIAEVVADVARGARRFASKLGSIGKAAFTPKSNSSRQTRSSPQVTPGASVISPESIKSTNSEDVKIGDEINLLEEPWIAAHGVYSCKAIRRPPFVEQIIAAAQSSGENQHFSSPTAMFRSFTQTARSVIEETFLMITETHIIEIRTSKLNMQIGTVVFCIKIDLMSKLKFRRQESISLFFKNAPEDPLIYMCPDSGDAVHQIQSVLKRKGVRGKHTNAAAYRAINEALEMVQAIQVKETALQYDPTIERVNEIMDLYRQTAEKFESAGDIRHEEVVTHMRKFLAKPTTISILDGSYANSTPPPQPTATTELLVSENVINDVLKNEKLGDSEQPIESPRAAAEEKQFVENIDNLLKEVKSDLHRDDDDDDDDYENDGTKPLSAEFTTEDIDLMTADLDAMMKEADKELAELMSS